METLSIGKRNAEFQRWETLKRNREKRWQRGEVFVEGVHPLECAMKYCWQVLEVATGPGRLSGWACDYIGKARPERHITFSAELMAELSDRDEPCELIAILRMKKLSPDDIPIKPNAVWALMDRPGSPGNLGSAMRSMDALGVSGLFLSGHGVDPMDTQCIRSSVGAAFALPYAPVSGVESLRSWRDAAERQIGRVTLVGTSAKAEACLHEIDLLGPALFLFGNETLGLSRALKEECDVLARLPQQGAATSYNLACAVSMSLYEARRQQGFAL